MNKIIKFIHYDGTMLIDSGNIVDPPSVPFFNLHKEEEVSNAKVEEKCLTGEEECLMRRTLAAHLDYIYTNKTKP
ncbi:Phytosulfokine [Cynara cardunculus var. scolymus]|uniref:Phytosulfokine n=1 Tax=Cynara cardunculus var. scolymus TaxID=59895 RepID=A0A103Y1H6_CYNCS|nr:Phytosulfokine [Cynara cardunculus var. scolymus]